MDDHDCFVMMCHDRLERAEAMVKQLTRERDDALSRWHQMAAMQKTLVELADKLFPSGAPHIVDEVLPRADHECGDGAFLLAAMEAATNSRLEEGQTLQRYDGSVVSSGEGGH